ncbi:uncharacterized protein LOC110875667 [Helianthus annuus]|uniref:uncharacterized protein LOC110875667 n=1 Tax=Helianthus annuus TaxID=4232 RepID=UPI000B8F485D|nr:uncharacterized protein LOC110875667 [Helianthus annuus]
MDKGKTDGSAKPSLSFETLANRVIDVDGNTWLPRRGIVQSSQTEPRKINIIDELLKTMAQVPVENEQSNTRVSENREDMAGFQVRTDMGSALKPMSYADSVAAAKTKKVNFRTLASPVVQDGCDVVLPRESVKLVQDMLANTLYGYFLGDRVAYPVVECFARNNWKKFGLQKSMMSANGFFFLKFADKDSMMNVLKEGPWIIRSQPLFLSVWSPTSRLEKKDVKKIRIWVKIHDVPIAAYTEDGLSMIATAIGEPKLLDSYTTTMCTDAWGRSSYARALIEVSAENDFKEEIVIAVPELEGEGFIKVFGHVDESCPSQPRKCPKEVPKPQKQNGGKQPRGPVKTPVVDEDGFMDVDGKKAARKPGVHVNKAKPKFEYRPIGVKTNGGAKKSDPSPSVVSRNPFDALRDEQGTVRLKSKGMRDDIADSDEEEVVEGQAPLPQSSPVDSLFFVRVQGMLFRGNFVFDDGG